MTVVSNISRKLLLLLLFLFWTGYNAKQNRNANPHQALKDKLAMISQSLDKNDSDFFVGKLISTAKGIKQQQKRKLNSKNIHRSLVNLLSSKEKEKRKKRNLMMQKTDTIHSVVTVPHFIPQISVPRIMVQHFNPPNAPLLPESIPKPEVQLHVRLPKPFANPDPKDFVDKTNGRDLFMKKSKNELKDTIKQAFLNALMYDDPLRTKYINGERKKLPEYSLSMISSPTKRMELNVKIKNKQNAIEDKIKKLLFSYKLYQEGVKHKLKYLDDVIAKWRQTRLNIIV